MVVDDQELVLLVERNALVGLALRGLDAALLASVDILALVAATVLVLLRVALLLGFALLAGIDIALRLGIAALVLIGLRVARLWWLLARSTGVHVLARHAALRRVGLIHALLRRARSEVERAARAVGTDARRLWVGTIRGRRRRLWVRRSRVAWRGSHRRLRIRDLGWLRIRDLRRLRVRLLRIRLRVGHLRIRGLRVSALGILSQLQKLGDQLGVSHHILLFLNGLRLSERHRDGEGQEGGHQEHLEAGHLCFFAL
jgi:hypothetical protein